MARYGNTSPSAVINAARSGRARQQAVNDQAAAFEYDTSAQTEADYNSYKAYLEGRLKNTTESNVGAKITIQSKLNSAYSAFTSNEIQRATDSINLGEATSTDKYNKIYSLYQRAATMGNANLAQNLASQLISLSKTIGLEQQAAYGRSVGGSGGRSSSGGSSGGSSTSTSSSKQIAQYINEGQHLAAQFELAAKNHRPLVNDDGSVIMRPGTNIPFVPTANEAGKIHATTLIQTKDMYEQAIAEGRAVGANVDGYLEKLDNLTKTDSFAGMTNETLLGLAQNNDTESVFTNKYDALGSSKGVELRPNVGLVPGKDGQGFVPLYGTGVEPSAFDSSGTAYADWNAKNTLSKDGYKSNYSLGTVQARLADKSIDPLHRDAIDPRSKRMISFLGAKNGTKEGAMLAGASNILTPGFAQYKYNKAGEDMTTGDAELVKDLNRIYGKGGKPNPYAGNLWAEIGSVGEQGWDNLTDPNKILPENMRNLPSDAQKAWSRLEKATGIDVKKNLGFGFEAKGGIPNALGSVLKNVATGIAREKEAAKQRAIAEAAARVQAAEAARVAQYNANIEAQRLAVATPAMVAAQQPKVSVQPYRTPNVSVRPYYTPNVSVQPYTTPNVVVAPTPKTPNVVVSGPKPAPAPQNKKAWWQFW